MSRSLQIKTTANRLSREGHEINIPYNVAASKYPLQVAKIIDQLHQSDADKTKNISPDKFKWYISYLQPEDPDVDDEAKFLSILKRETKVYLKATFDRWRGVTEIIGEIPKQIINRYQGHTKLICAAKKLQHKSLTPVEDVIVSDNFIEPMNVSSLEDDVSRIMTLIENLSVHYPNYDSDYIKLIRHQLTALKEFARIAAKSLIN